jgi:uncharacterized protein YhaN
VAALVSRIAPGLDGLTPEDAVTQLNIRLVEQHGLVERQREIGKRLTETLAEISATEADKAAATERLQALSSEAGCTNNEAALDSAEQDSTRHRELTTAKADLEREILEAGEGAGITDLATEVDGVDADVLPAQVERLRIGIEQELEPRLADLLQTKGRRQKELDLMDGSDAAARLADDAQATLATLRADAERYLRIRLATRILRAQIETYRQQNQGPVLARASDHFNTLTIGSFAGLATDFDTKDEPILVGLRPDEGRVHVDGMSAGTRDQLYLALRLASLEKYLDSHEPMPFIVDDILVDFDDQRSAAALQALADLAERTQVILFSHHSQVVTLAQALSGAVQIHNL